MEDSFMQILVRTIRVFILSIIKLRYTRYVVVVGYFLGLDEPWFFTGSRGRKGASAFSHYRSKDPA
jgi:hypothetical protein